MIEDDSNRGNEWINENHRQNSYYMRSIYFIDEFSNDTLLKNKCTERNLGELYGGTHIYRGEFNWNYIYALPREKYRKIQENFRKIPVPVVFHQADT